MRKPHKVRQWFEYNRLGSQVFCASCDCCPGWRFKGTRELRELAVDFHLNPEKLKALQDERR